MGFCQIKFCLLLLVSLTLLAPLSGNSFVSDDVFGSTAALGERRLLQAKQRCPVSFEFQNYTDLVSRCKGPSYSANMCCTAFTDFACPFVDYLNDVKNDCATTMFSYINLHGNYPPGLFANECKEGPEGLECPDAQPDSAQGKNSSSSPVQKNLWYLLLAISFFLLQFI